MNEAIIKQGPGTVPHYYRQEATKIYHCTVPEPGKCVAEEITPDRALYLASMLIQMASFAISSGR